MSKIRVYNLAKMFEMSNTEMVELLTEIGVNIKSHMSSINEEVYLLVEEELKKRKDAEEKKAVEAITTYPIVTVSEGSSVSDVAASIGEKPGSAVKILMSEGLMVPATVAADEKILEILGKGFEKHFVFGTQEEIKAAEDKSETKDRPKKKKRSLPPKKCQRRGRILQ